MKEKIELLKLEKRRYDLDQKISLIEKYKLWRNWPIQKIIGFVTIANVDIDVSKKVLLPRYETEELILLALNLIRKNEYKLIFDLCCGSGVVGVALKKNNDHLNIWQSDIDKKAIKQTKINNIKNSINNFIIKSNMFKNINNKFDLIISNPPYLKIDEKKTMSKSVLKYEPHKALFAKNDGLMFYEIIESEARNYLNANGMILLEINPLNSFWFKQRDYVIVNDINGKERFAYKYFNQF